MRTPVLFSAFMIFLLAGCGSGDNKKTVPAAKATPVKNSSQTDSSVTGIVHKESIIIGQSQPYAGQYTIIKKLYNENGTWYINADYIQFLMGDEATAAAIKKGAADTTTDNNGHMTIGVPDDYFILNDNTKIRKLALEKDAVLQVIVYDENGNAYLENTSIEKLNKHLADNIFILQLKNGWVKNIKQQYLP